VRRYTSLAVLPARPDVAVATLSALAAFHGTRQDIMWDEEPWNIVHEVRPAISVARQGYLGLEVPPEGELRYYGSADATPLLLHLLGAIGDAALAAELEPAWRAAGDWLMGALERGDAFSYHRGSVWPFDWWLGWGGLRAAGHHEAADRVRAGMLAGVERIGRFPELYAVTHSGPESTGISNQVQAWTVGALWGLRHEWDGAAHVVA
jgi:glycogen debranching enzyme